MIPPRHNPALASSCLAHSLYEAITNIEQFTPRGKTLDNCRVEDYLAIDKTLCVLKALYTLTQATALPEVLPHIEELSCALACLDVGPVRLAESRLKMEGN